MSFDAFYQQSDAVIQVDLRNWYLSLFFCYVFLYVIFLIILQCYTARRILTPIRDLTELIKNPAGLKNEKRSKPIIKNSMHFETEHDHSKTQNTLN